MKIWADKSYSWLYDDENLLFGVASYKHKRKEWKGFTIHFNFLKWLLAIKAVDNFPEYDRVVNMRRARVKK